VRLVSAAAFFKFASFRRLRGGSFSFLRASVSAGTFAKSVSANPFARMLVGRLGSSLLVLRVSAAAFTLEFLLCFSGYLLLARCTSPLIFLKADSGDLISIRNRLCSSVLEHKRLVSLLSNYRGL